MHNRKMPLEDARKIYGAQRSYRLTSSLIQQLDLFALMDFKFAPNKKYQRALVRLHTKEEESVQHMKEAKDVEFKDEKVNKRINSALSKRASGKLRSKHLCRAPKDDKSIDSLGVYQCGQCNYKLFARQNVLPHAFSPFDVSDWSCLYMFIEPMDWIKEDVNAETGKLFCPSCNLQLGEWDWYGLPCSCKLPTRVVPSFRLRKVRLSSTWLESEEMVRREGINGWHGFLESETAILSVEQEAKRLEKKKHKKQKKKAAAKAAALAAEKEKKEKEEKDKAQAEPAEVEPRGNTTTIPKSNGEEIVSPKKTTKDEPIVMAQQEKAQQPNEQQKEQQQEQVAKAPEETTAPNHSDEGKGTDPASSSKKKKSSSKAVEELKKETKKKNSSSSRGKKNPSTPRGDQLLSSASVGAITTRTYEKAVDETTLVAVDDGSGDKDSTKKSSKKSSKRRDREPKKQLSDEPTHTLKEIDIATNIVATPNGTANDSSLSEDNNTNNNKNSSSKAASDEKNRRGT
eukprot:TRINITY_DN1870_c2_g1_i4.p2 TRINITY_DN1870_c2_g1~~TRINITY_DN1870_c2_g1_i4.p2  ORF type:complete len:513 (+),score=143.55 TRINITY_DN1870_c2_g1_i4:559-2097(+)